MSEQLIVFAVFGVALVLFVWGRWRYDLVALLALLVLTILGIVPAKSAFLGIGHPAVITVAAVLVVSRGLENAGVINLVAQGMSRIGEGTTKQVGAVTGLVALLSGFINNVGALALLMPVAVRVARERGGTPALLLMPLAFGSLLGGTMTLIGTPANLIVSAFRAEQRGAPFQMFDFFTVGLGLTVLGVLFITLRGWRLIPLRPDQDTEQPFRIEDYLTEVRVPVDSPMTGEALRDLGSIAEGVLVVGLVRDDHLLPAPSSFETLREEDILLAKADADALERLVVEGGLMLVGREGLFEDVLESDEVRLVEVVVRPRSLLDGETARTLDLRWRYGLNLLAASRHRARPRQRLDRIRFQPGDVLLLQGRAETSREALAQLGGLPLAERSMQWGKRRPIPLALALFAAGVIAAGLEVVPVQIAFVTAAAAMVIADLLSLAEAYESIDWPILVLLGAMIPVGQALESTGGADLIAGYFSAGAVYLSPTATLALLLAGTMLLSNVINNAAAAVLMAPIVLSVAQGLGFSADPFLIGVAVGSGCAFVNPHWAPIQHAGDGTRRVRVQRLLAVRFTALDSRRTGRDTPDRLVLALGVTVPRVVMPQENMP